MRNLPFTTSDPARQVTTSARKYLSTHGSEPSSPPFGGQAERAGKSRLGMVPPSRSASPAITSDSSRRKARRDRKLVASSAYACGLGFLIEGGKLELAASRTQTPTPRPARSCSQPHGKCISPRQASVLRRAQDAHSSISRVQQHICLVKWAYPAASPSSHPCRWHYCGLACIKRSPSVIA
jgi:hypothetical protein